MIIFGLSFFVYSLLESSFYGQVYFDEDYHCIEKFRRPKKAADAVSFLHNMTKAYFGALMIAVAVMRLSGNDAPFLGSFVLAGFALVCLDALVSEAVIRHFRMKQLRDAIWRQWKTQKHVTPENDHEVNMYRGTVRLTMKYPRHIIGMGLSMVVLQLMA
jgi:hypothetical protein